jgi:hypothetical protein
MVHLAEMIDRMIAAERRIETIRVRKHLDLASGLAAFGSAPSLPL